jgi:hypothetical protein
LVVWKHSSAFAMPAMKLLGAPMFQNYS